MESTDSILNAPDITRVEVIDRTGRAYTNYATKNVKILIQDGRRTLKIFTD